MLEKILGKGKKNEAKLPKIAVGLDIGTTKVVAFAGQRDPDGKIRVLGYGKHSSLGVQRGQVINVIKTADAILHAIRQTEDRAGIDIDTVMVGIAGQHIRNQQQMGEIKIRNSESEITRQDVRLLIDDMFKIVVAPGEQIIDAIHQEYTVDGISGLDDPVGVVGSQLSSVFNIITGNSQHIRNIARCVKRCRLEMDGLMLEPIASAEVVLDHKEKESGVALVDIGGGTTDVAVFVNGILRHTAVIPIAGDVITDDIKSVFKGIVKDDAETLKLTHGTCVPNRGNENHIISIPGIKDRPPIEISEVALAEVIAARMKEIIDRVMEELRSVNCLNKLGCGLVLTGGGAKLKHIKEFTEYHTALSVRVGNPEEKMIIEKEADWYHPMYATGLGLLVMGIEKDEDLHPAIPKTSSKSVEEKVGKTKKVQNTEKEEDTERERYRPWLRMQEMLTGILVDEDGEDDF
jgi:cell division protein FtsA